MVQTYPGEDRRLQQRARDRKRAILEAAAREFRTRGFHATGMRDIAAALGVTVGSLYYYFQNKEALLAFCQEDALTRLQRLADWVGRQELPADGRLFLLVEGHVACLNEGTPGSLAHLEVESLSEERRRPILRQRDRYERRLRQLIEEGVRHGIFRATDPKVAALAILGAVNWTVKWYRQDGGRDSREIGRAFAEQMVRGLLAGGREPHIPENEVPRWE